MADQNITALPATTTPESSDQLLLVGATEEKLIDYDKLADAILGKIASKNFALDQGNKTLLQALNELNSKVFFSNIDRESNTYGRCIVVGDAVIALLIIVVTDTAKEWTVSIEAPKPKYGSINIKDTRGEHSFQINTYGIFQNADALSPGRYVVNAIYIK